jgi:uncharacterized membrane protein YbaN (DUF454 family)
MIRATGRLLWIIAGLVCLVIGIAGTILPFVPGTLFLIVAAFCFARGSQRLHDWLVNHPQLGPVIRDWQQHGAIRRPAKRMAMVAIVLSIVLAFVLGAPLWALGFQALALAGVSIFILTRPEGPRQ